MKTLSLLFISLCITVMLQAQVSKTANVTAGHLKVVLTANELNTVTNLTLTGTIDARDFKTMRDDMPVLAEIDLSGIKIVEYIGTEGTSRNTGPIITYPANAIPEYAYLNDYIGGKGSLTSIIFPPSVTSIGLNAFAYTGLTSVSIPPTVTTIGSYAFASCLFQTPVTIPASVTTLGFLVFFRTGSDINVDADNIKYSSIDGVLFNKSQTTLIECPNSRTGVYEIPASVTEIASSAFEECFRLTSVSIPYKLTSIGERAFFGCGGLTSVTIPSSVTYLGSWAFMYCSGLTSMFANASNPVNLSAPSDVFYGVDKTQCTLLVPYGTALHYASAKQWQDFTNIVEAVNGLKVSSNNVNIEAAGGSTSTIDVTANVVWSATSDQTWLTVNPRSGSNNSKLTFTAEAYSSIGTRKAIVTLSATDVDAQQTIIVTQNGSNAPINITAGGLATVLTADELTSFTKLTLSGTIDARDFKTMRDDMPLLAEIDLSGVKIAEYNGIGGTSIEGRTNYPANVIPEFAFVDYNYRGKISLTSIVFPKSIIKIGKFAFNECFNLTSVNIPPSVKTLEQNVFTACKNLNSIIIPEGVKTIGNQAFYRCSGTFPIFIPASVTSIEGAAFILWGGLINVDDKNLNYSSSEGVLFNKSRTDLIVCPGTKIGNYIIPSTVKSIWPTAFGDCSGLTSVLIPSSVTTIQNSAFQYCTGLTSVTLPSSVTRIDNSVFTGCENLSSIYAYSSYPVDLSSSQYVFWGINKTTCTLYVPYGTKGLYAAAAEWKEFTNIEEISFVELSGTNLTVLNPEGATARLTINSDITWTASSDHTWLTVNPGSGTGKQSLAFTANANPSILQRTAKVTISAPGIDSQIITVTQAAKPAVVTAGGLKALLTAEELSSVTSLKLTGTIDARDFKTMRDDMPLLAELDLSGVTVAAYTGTGGTTSRYGESSTYYANAIPANAFCNEKTEKWNTNLTSIVFPSNVTSIEWHAFLYCTGLNSINIPSSVTSVGEGTFALCTGLKSLNIPSSVITIGAAAFMDCSKLTSVIIPPSVTSIGAVAFAGCTNLTSVNIPFSVINIGWAPFEGSGTLINADNNNPNYSSIDGILFNKTLTDLLQFPSSRTGNFIIPSSVKSIRQHAFGGCTNLTSVTIPSSVDTIEIGAFINCSGLSSISIPSSVNSIGEYAFAYCSGLSSIYTNSSYPLKLNSSPSVFSEVDKTNCILHVPYGSKTAYQVADQWKDFTNIEEMPGIKLSASTKNLKAQQGSNTTINLTSNTNWTISSDQPWITVNPTSGTGDQTLTFTADANPSDVVRKATISVSATGVESQTVSLLQARTRATVNLTAGGLKASLTPEELSTITKLTLTGTIDARDFKTMRDDIPMLAEIDLSGATVTSYNGNEGTNTSITQYPANAIPACAFYIDETGKSKTGLNSFLFPSQIVSIEWAAFYGSSGLTSISIPVSVNSIGQGALGGCTGLTSLIIPPSVISIGPGAFEFCSNLTSLIISSSVTSIGGGAFQDCNKLATVTIPPTVISIGIFAFYNSVSEINVDKNNPNYSSIDGVLFNKSQTTLIEYPNLRTGNCIIPSSVTTIAEAAFANSYGLTSCYIPSSVKSIERSAFNGSGLTTVVIPSSVTFIGEYAFNGCVGLSSINSNSSIPIDLNSSQNVFDKIDKTSCILYVAFGRKALYAVSNQWKDFTNIVEMPGFMLAENTANLAAEQGSTANVNITSDIEWSASSDQAWLELDPTSGNDIQTLTFTADANPSPAYRKAQVTVSASGVDSQTIFVTQAASSAPLNSTAGDLKTSLTANELATITKLTLTGTIDARDFKTMRDDMPNLAELDLAGATIAEYTGTEGTYWELGAIITYPANEIPILAFRNEKSVNTTLGSVILPVNATSIGWDAFCLVTKLSSIIIPPTITNIGVAAFAGCPFSTVTIPSSVTQIDVVAFSGSGYINVETGNPNYCSIDGVLFNKDKTTLMQCPYSKTGTYSILPSVTRVDDHAFEYCRDLTSVDIPSSVAAISHFAFLGCTNLTSIAIPSKVTYLGDWAFSDCTGLTSIYSRTLVPVDLSHSKEVFLNVDKTNCTLYVPYGTKQLYAVANLWKDFVNILEMPGFMLSEFTVNLAAKQGSSASVNVTSNITWTASSDQSWLTINPGSGAGVKALTFTAEANPSILSRTAIVTVSATGADSQTILVTQEASSAVVTAGNLETILSAEELSSVTKLTLTGTIDARDFKTMRDNMPNLTEIDLSGVKVVEYTGTEGTEGTSNFFYSANTIPSYAFCNPGTNMGTSTISSFIFPAKITSIGNNAFSFCKGLTSLDIPATVLSIGSAAFGMCSNLVSVTIPISVKLIENSAFYGFGGLFKVDPNNPYYTCSDNVVFSKSQKNLIQCSTSKTGDYIIPSGVNSIENGAFAFCGQLTSLTIPSSVLSIGHNAFLLCMGLTAIINHANPPVDLSSTQNVFQNVDKTNCTLYVPYRTKGLYVSADQWKDFTNIIEMPGFILSTDNIELPAYQGSSAILNITSDIKWTVNSDQSWFTVNPGSGTGIQTLIFTAEANSGATIRTAKVTVSATGIESQTITVTQQIFPVSTGEVDEISSLLKCYPNPFTDEIIIEIQNPKHTEISVNIYNLAGERIKNLATNRKDEKVDLKWYGTNDSGKKVAPGVYICKVNNWSKQLIYQGN